MKTVRLGVFIVGSLAVLAAGIFLIGSRRLAFHSTYSLKAEFQNAGDYSLAPMYGLAEFTRVQFERSSCRKRRTER
jgi:hypothetical protein